MEASFGELVGDLVGAIARSDTMDTQAKGDAVALALDLLELIQPDDQTDAADDLHNMLAGEDAQTQESCRWIYKRIRQHGPRVATVRESLRRGSLSVADLLRD